MSALLLSSGFKQLTWRNGIMIDFKVGYSSPAESGIMDELGLSLAEVCKTSIFLWPYFE